MREEDFKHAFGKILGDNLTEEEVHSLYAVYIFLGIE
jgi:hypothetical protein